MFKLTDKEMDFLVSQLVLPSKKHFGGSKPFAFSYREFRCSQRLSQNTCCYGYYITINHPSASALGVLLKYRHLRFLREKSGFYLPTLSG